MKLTRYTRNLLISIDQLINSLLLGDPDETISARSHRLAVDSTGWSRAESIIDAMFFWDTFTTSFGTTIKHCEFSHLMELKRKQTSISSYKDRYLELVKELNSL